MYLLHRAGQLTAKRPNRYGQLREPLSVERRGFLPCRNKQLLILACAYTWHKRPHRVPRPAVPQAPDLLVLRRGGCGAPGAAKNW